jgi:NAD(P)-dependent dehydrogenase (short-subunit alcohol dehydrogenase family)
MQGKTVLITGGSNGIGEATAKALASKGAHVVIVGRNRDKTDRVVNTIKTDTQNPNISALYGDLSLMADVRRVAAEFLAAHDRLDVLINNAGSFFEKREVTAEGIEMTWALNHLAYFVLTLELLDLLKATAAAQGEARVINVSSGAHMMSKINFDDLDSEKGFSGFGVYGKSKLANVMFTYALARRLNGTGVTTNALHPGAVATGFGQSSNGIVGMAFKMMRGFFKTPEQGASTVVHLASSPAVKGMTSGYWDNSKLAKSSAYSHDEAAQERLWEVSLSRVQAVQPA